MWSILKNGLLIIKHGRSGKPKPKLLFCDDNMTKVFWRAAPPPKQDNYHGLFYSSGQHTDDDNSTVQNGLIDDSASQSHEYDLRRNERRSTLFSFQDPFRRRTFNKSDNDREIFFKDILSVSY